MTVRISQEYERYTDFIRRLPDTFEREGELIYSGRNKVKLFIMPDGTKFVVKSYKRPWLLQRFVYTFIRKSKAHRAYEYAGRLNGLGFKTPAGAAYIEVRNRGLLRDTYFVSAHTSLPDVRTVIESSDKATGEQLIKAAARFMAELHRKGVIHGDPNLSNILVDISRTPYSFELIDTNRSKFLAGPAPYEQIVQNLVRVTHVRDLSHRFCHEYAAATGLNPESLEKKVEHELCRFEKKRHIRRKLLFKS